MPEKIPLSSLPRHIAQQASKHLEGEDLVFVDTASFWRTHRLTTLTTMLVLVMFCVGVGVATAGSTDVAALYYAMIAMLPIWCVVLVVLGRRHARHAPFLLVSTRSAMISQPISLPASHVTSVHVIDLRGIRDVVVQRGLCGLCACCAPCNVVTLRIVTQADEHFSVSGLSQPERAYDFLMRGTVLAIPMMTPKKPAALAGSGAVGSPV